MDDIDAVARRSADLEHVAEAVEHCQQYLVDLDRRMHMSREGSRRLKSDKVPSEKKVWVLCPGGVFMRSSAKNVLSMLEDDVSDTQRSIEVARDELKVRVAELAQLEGPASTLARLQQGFNLNAA